MSDRIFVEQYCIGIENVRLYALPKDGGGSFTLAPADLGCAEIEVGLNVSIFDCVNILLHESFEFACVRKSIRFDPSCSSNFGHDGYHFFMSHNQMTEVICMQSWVITEGVEKLKDCWKKHSPQSPDRQKTKAPAKKTAKRKKS